MTFPFDGRETTRPTLELAPKSRFDIVDLRSHFSAEHEALGATPLPLLVVSYDRRIPRSQPGGAFERPRSLATSMRSGRCSRRAQGTSTIGSNAGRSRPAQRAVEPRNADSHLAFIAGDCAPASNTRIGPASLSAGLTSTA